MVQGVQLELGFLGVLVLRTGLFHLDGQSLLEERLGLRVLLEGQMGLALVKIQPGHPHWGRA